MRGRGSVALRQFTKHPGLAIQVDGVTLYLGGRWRTWKRGWGGVQRGRVGGRSLDGKVGKGKDGKRGRDWVELEEEVEEGA